MHNRETTSLKKSSKNHGQRGESVDAAESEDCCIIVINCITFHQSSQMRIIRIIEPSMVLAKESSSLQKRNDSSAGNGDPPIPVETVVYFLSFFFFFSRETKL
jgi:hypothetical protein